MTLTYPLTLADYKAAYRLHRRQKFSRRWAPLFWPTLLVACLIGFFAFSVVKKTDLAAACFEVGAGALLASILMPILRSMHMRRGYRHLFPSTRTDLNSYCSIDDEYIIRELPGMSQLRVLWSGLFGFAQDEAVTLFYTNKDCFLIIPTRTFSPDQRIELDELVARHVPKAKP